MAIGRGETGGFTVPAINVRTLTYDFARLVFRTARRLDAGAVIFEIARSEMGYTQQRPREFASCVLGAATAENWTLPVFIQADHTQFDAKKYAQDPEGVTRGIRDLVLEALAAGFFNIDIDASTLVDLSRPTVRQQQEVNYMRTAEMTDLIRANEPEGVTVSVGGEIGEVGKKNSTVEEFVEYAEGVREELAKRRPGAAFLSKVSVQTGTTHGGIPLPDGTIAQVKIDFEVHRAITKVARERYGMAGTVQHGASTLPLDLFGKFPESDAIEIHLATEFQNIIYDHLPEGLRAQMYEWIKKNLADEFKAGETEAQNIYKTRKKAFGPFKKDLWGLEPAAKERILAALGERLEKMFHLLKIAGTRETVEKYIRAPRIVPPPPRALASLL
jgi:fructose/tagatose bisphosphate aldolase